jgi:hypothetical protein
MKTDNPVPSRSQRAFTSIVALSLALASTSVPAADAIDPNNSAPATGDSVNTSAIFGSATGQPNDTTLPLVFLFDADPRAAEEGPDRASLLLIRGGDISQSLTVRYSIGGTAQNEIDYQPLLGSVTIPAGAFTAPIVITPIDDNAGEDRETVVIALAQPNANADSYRIRWPGRATATISDNDGGVPSPPIVNLFNPPDGAKFRGPLELHLFAQADDRDGFVTAVQFFANEQRLGGVSNFIFHPIPTTAGTAGGQSGVELDVNNLPVGTTLIDPNGGSTAGTPPGILPPIFPFTLTWKNAAPGTYALRAVATDNSGLSTTSAVANITIEQDVSQPIVNVFVRDATASESTRTGAVNTASFVLYRSGSVVADLNVQFSLSGSAVAGTDYEQLPTSAIIPAGVREVPIALVPIDDNEVEPTESIVLELQPIACIRIFPPPADCYELGRSRVARARLLDNDRVATNQPPSVAIFTPGDGCVHVAPERLFVAASAWDLDGSVRSVEFFDGDTSLGLVSNNTLQLDTTAALSFLPPWSLGWSNITCGEHVLTAKAIDNEGAETISRPVSVRIVESNTLPVVTIRAVDAEAAEPNPNPPGAGVPSVLNTATFRVHRTGPTHDDLFVIYRTDGRARAGVDYTLPGGGVTITAGHSEAEIELIPLDDAIPEGPENVIIALTSTDIFLGTGGGAFGAPLPPTAYRIGQPGSAEIVIRDNDGTASNSPPNVDIARPLTRSVHDRDRPIAVEALSFDRDGFVPQAKLFANGTLIQEVNIAFLLPPPPGSPHAFSFIWSNAPAGHHELTVRVTDDDGAHGVSASVHITVIEQTEQTVVGVRTVDPSASEGGSTVTGAINSELNTATFELTRKGNTDRALTVFYRMRGSATMGADYQNLPGEIQFQPHQTTRRIVIVPHDDDRVEPTESVYIEILPPLCLAIFPPTPDCYRIDQRGSASASIRDNDESRNRAPRVVVTNPERGQRLSAPADIRIEVATRDSDGYVSQMEFFAGDHKLGDTVVHFFETPPPNQRQVFTLGWTNVPPGEYAIHARATDNLGAVGTSDPVSVLVRETNAVPIVNIHTRDGRASEASGTAGHVNPAVLVLTRSGNTNQDLTIFLEIGGLALNGIDYRTIASPIIFPAGDRTLPIEIIPIDDSVPERRESVVIGLLQPVTTIPHNYEIGPRRKAAAVIIDNDREGPPIDPTTTTGSALDDGSVHVTLVGVAGQEVVIEVSDNMIDWFELIRTTVADGTIDFVDPEALLKRANFYRIIPVEALTTAVEAQRRF